MNEEAPGVCPAPRSELKILCFVIVFDEVREIS